VAGGKTLTAGNALVEMDGIWGKTLWFWRLLKQSPKITQHTPLGYPHLCQDNDKNTDT
jgi:hypothetical protein